MSIASIAFDAAAWALRTYARITPTGRGGYRLVRAVRRLAPRSTLVRQYRTPHGMRLKLDLSTYPDCTMAFGLYELTTARLIQRLLRPNDHMVDGGANLGYFTMLAAQCVGPTGRVDAFEPQPDNRARLVEHLRLNGLTDRVRVHDAALSDRAGTATIHYFGNTDRYNHGSSSLFDDPDDPAVKKTTVPTVRMDEHLAGASPRLIKLDLEGAEAMAAAGMTGLLQGDPPPAVVTEFDANNARAAGVEPTTYIERLLAAQPAYGVWVIGARLKRIDPTPRIMARLGQVNLLFRQA